MGEGGAGWDSAGMVSISKTDRTVAQDFMPAAWQDGLWQARAG
jgi:hypothetical protein